METLRVDFRAPCQGLGLSMFFVFVCVCVFFFLCVCVFFFFFCVCVFFFWGGVGGSGFVSFRVRLWGFAVFAVISTTLSSSRLPFPFSHHCFDGIGYNMGSSLN